MKWDSSCHPVAQTLAKLVLLVVCPAVLSGADKSALATASTSQPAVPSDYRWRWIPADSYYEVALKDDEPEQPESWGTPSMPLLKEALRIAPSSFAHPNLLMLQLGTLPRGLEEKFTGVEIASIRQMMIGYLKHLKELRSRPESPAGLDWHALYVAAMTARLWPDEFETQTLHPDSPRLAAELLWKRQKDDGEEWYGEYRVSEERLLVMDEQPWKLFEFESGKWQNFGLPEDMFGNAREPFRVGLGKNVLSTISAVFDFQTHSWARLPNVGSEVYLSDPIETRVGWMFLYKNPPHYNLEKIENFERLPKEEQDRLRESLRDRVHFLSLDGKASSVATDFAVNQSLLLKSGRVCLVGSAGVFPHPAQVEEDIELISNAGQKPTEPQMSGYFNGDWHRWDDKSQSDRLMLEQRHDYEGEMPVRAAVYDLEVKKWELLWNDPSRAIPPPPPGILNEVLSQTPRWTLPSSFTDNVVGMVRTVAPSLNRDGKVLLLSLVRDVIHSRFSLELCLLDPARPKPLCFDVVLPGYRPGSTWDERFTHPSVHFCKTGLLFADSAQGKIWHLKWDFEKGSLPASSEQKFD